MLHILRFSLRAVYLIFTDGRAFALFFSLVVALGVDQYVSAQNPSRSTILCSTTYTAMSLINRLGVGFKGYTPDRRRQWCTSGR